MPFIHWLVKSSCYLGDVYTAYNLANIYGIAISFSFITLEIVPRINYFASRISMSTGSPSSEK